MTDFWVFLLDFCCVFYFFKNRCWGVKGDCFYPFISPKIIGFEISFEKAFLTICDLCNGFRSEKVGGKGVEMLAVE